MSIFHTNSLVGSSGQGGGGYAISRSLRFNSSDSAYLSRTPASAGNRKIFTLSLWAKPSSLSGYNTLFSADGNRFVYRFGSASANNIEIYYFDGSVYQLQLVTSAVYRDPSAWYHLQLSCNTDAATASDRVKLYVNGMQVTTFSTASYPSSGLSLPVNNTVAHYLGTNTVAYFSGLLADIHFCDGTAYDASAFGEFDANGIWQPKQFAGVYGSQGWHLDFADNSTAAALGTDSSGLGNTWSVNNISVSNGLTSVAAATGALPVYNTTDTYGAVKGTGTRTDSNSSSIVLAVPMDGTNNGITFTDESATIKGSGSAKSITRNGDTKTSTTQSKFYGSSGYFDGSGDYLTAGTSSDYIFGTGDFTIECWAYFSTLNTDNALITNHNNDSNWVFKVVSGKLQYYPGDGNGSSINGTSTIGTGSWYHFSATRQSNTLRLFVNGVLETTATVSANYTVNNTLYIGAQQNNLAGTYLNGYLQDARIYKGVAKYTSNFNPPSSTQNPTLAAGNDSLVDVPSSTGTDTGVGGEVRGNYCTLNPLTSTSGTYSQGNLRFVGPSAYRRSNGSIAVSTGKWYWEVTLGNGPVTPRISTSQWNAFGFGLSTAFGSTTNMNAVTDALVLQDNGYYKNFSGSNTDGGTAFSSGDVLSIAVDLDANTFTFRRNNTQIVTGTIGGTAGRELVPVIISYDGQYGVMDCNFGQRPFAYPVAGYKSLNTASLPSPLVTKPSTVFDTYLWSGNGGTQTISTSFSPDFVWVKQRDNTNVASHVLVDIVRGNNNVLRTNGTDAENAAAIDPALYDGVTNLSTASFDVVKGSSGTYNGTNGSGKSYVGWCWDAGSSTVTNTQGSITSSVRANATAGFSIVTYTGNGTSGATVGHGLNVAPQLLIVKRRSSAGSTANWAVWHGSLTAGQNLFLNTTDSASAYSPSRFTSTLPTSTVFSIGGGDETNYSGGTFVCYAFSPVSGYSSFGSYVGTGAVSTGPFCYTGFRPRLIILKAAVGGTSGWIMVDTARNTYNAVDYFLQANSSGAESTQVILDSLSNGFVIRPVGDAMNNSGVTFVWAAFAESPFQYARAR